MKKIIVLLTSSCFISNILLVPPILATESNEPQKTRIAVMNLDSKDISKDVADTVSDFLRYDLFNTGKFEVIERTNMEKILAEQKFQLTGCTSTECAIEVGKLLNAKKIIIGTVSKLGNNFFITARMVDVETGKIEASERAKCAGEAELELGSKLIAYKFAGINPDEKLLKGDTKLVMEEERTKTSPAQQYYVAPEIPGTSWLTWTGIGLGVVFGIVGLGAASSNQSKADDNYTLYLAATTVDDATYYRSQVDYYDKLVATDNTIATVGFITAGALLAIEIISSATSSDKKTSSISENFKVSITPQNLNLALVKTF